MKKFNTEAMLNAYDRGISQQVINRLVDELPNCLGVYGCDLQDKLFNESPCFKNAFFAEKTLEALGVFKCIKLVELYEFTNFGSTFTAIEPLIIANVVCYIMGEFIKNSTHLTQNCWSDKLTENDLAVIEDELQTYLENLEFDLFDETNNKWRK